MEQLKSYLKLATKTLLITGSIYLIFFSYFSLKNIKYHLAEIKSQNEELYKNQINVYNEVLKAQTAGLIIQEQLAEGIDKAKVTAKDQDNAIMKMIYKVDSDSKKRDVAIIDGVNGVVDSFNVALSKPSYNYLRAITVYIFASKKTDPEHGWIGTGVIIGINKNNMFILTNRHVMPNTDDMNYYVIENGKKYKLVNIKVSQNEKVDLSLNKVEELIPGKRAVVGLADTQAQDNVYMVGSNLGRPFLYAEGTVSGYDVLDENFDLIVGMPSGPGNSGSGVINKEGKLVGVLYAGSIISEDGIYQMDTSHGVCQNIKVIRLFLSGYINE